MTRAPIAIDETLLTFKEALAYLRISRSTMYRLLARREVIGHKVGANWRFRRVELDACVRDAGKAVGV